MKTNRTRYLIYGAGNTGRRVLDILLRRGEEVLGFVDAAAKRIGSVGGLPVFTVHDAAQVPEWRESSITIIVAVFNPLASMRSILSDLADAGFVHVVDFFAFYRLHAQEIGISYWLTTDPILYKRNAGIVRELRAMLADEKSRDLLDQIIKFRQSLDLNDLPVAAGMSSQYFPDDIPIRREEVYFVDCGAYDGDTVSAFARVFSAH